MSEDERSPRALDLSAPGLSGDGWRELLSVGAIEVLGRMPDSSNATFLVQLGATSGVHGGAIYKPERGERPLWDFPDGLFRREVAAYELSAALGLELVPETILRFDAPYGVGSLQRFVAADPMQHYFQLFEDGLCDEDLRRLAGFDLLLNNADRKGGHVLQDPGGHLWGIDHGLCFHVERKLRTVMWDYAGDEVPEEIQRACEAVAARPPKVLEALLDEEEIEALVLRAERLLAGPRFPAPSGSHREYPWPLV